MTLKSTTILVTILASVAIAACNETSFTSPTPKLGRTGSEDGGQSTGGSTSGSSTGNTSGDSTGGDDGRQTGGSTDVVPSVPLRVFYQAGNHVDTIPYTGNFIFKVERDGAPGTQTELLNTRSFGTGSTSAFQTKDLPNLCYCGTKNAFKMTINVNGEQDVASWKSRNIVMLARSYGPLNGASDILGWMEERLGNNFNFGQHTILLGGFDHELFSGNFPEPGTEWSSNDDFKAIFTCLVNQCPNGSAETSLEFVGTGI